MKKIYTLLSILFAMSIFAQNQNIGSTPDFVSTATKFKIVQPFSQQVHQSPDTTLRTVNNNRWLNYPTNFEALPRGRDPLVNTNNQQRTPTVANRPPIESFDGAIDGVHAGSGVPDPTGAVGPNHYIHSYNSGFVIFNKDGSIALPHASLAMIWPGETTGDPVVLFDRYAERFVITQFTGNPFGGEDPSNGILFAICQGTDPVNDGWYTYFFPTGTFPDYPKYSTWHDGYYFTANKGGQHFYAVERDKMIIGDPTAQIQGFTLPGINANPNTVFAPLPINSIGPNLPDPSSPGYVTYLQDDAWAGGVDHLKFGR